MTASVRSPSDHLLLNVSARQRWATRSFAIDPDAPASPRVPTVSGHSVSLGFGHQSRPFGRLGHCWWSQPIGRCVRPRQDLTLGVVDHHRRAECVHGGTLSALSPMW